jgi:hypothetical protein
MLDVGLEEDRDRVVGDLAAGQRDGVDEPAPPAVGAHLGHLADVGQGRHDRVIGGQRRRGEPRDAVAAVHGAPRRCSGLVPGWRGHAQRAKVVSKFSEPDLTRTPKAWLLSHGSHVGVATGGGAGDQTVKVQSLRTVESTECVAGWNTDNTGTLLIEEIP